jgi:hypothetical protein
MPLDARIPSKAADAYPEDGTTSFYPTLSDPESRAHGLRQQLVLTAGGCHGVRGSATLEDNAKLALRQAHLMEPPGRLTNRCERVEDFDSDGFGKIETLF